MLICHEKKLVLKIQEKNYCIKWGPLPYSMSMVMDPRKHRCRGVVASAAKVATTSSASLASTAVTASAAACLGAVLESLELVGLLRWPPGSGSFRSCSYFHRCPDVHINIRGYRNLLVGLLGLCWPLGDDGPRVMHCQVGVALAVGKKPPQLVHCLVDLVPDLGYVPIGENTVIQPLGLAIAGPRLAEDERVGPKAPQGEVDLEEGLTGSQHLAV